MTAYVDASIHKLGRMTMRHMLTDSEKELHEMADKIGIQRKWYQPDASTPHYDICKSKRKLAVYFGAKEVDRRELVKVIKSIRVSIRIDAW